VTTVPEFDPTAAPVIDDLTFEDLLRIALEEVPGASQGRWTVHGPVDPGVTLLELFAWQFEQRLFMADQVTEQVTRAGLRLLGISAASAPTAASTVLSFQPTAAPVVLAAGTLVDLDGDAAGRGFTLDETVSVLPVGAIEVAGSLQNDGDTLEFRHHYTGPALADQTVSLLVDVAAAPGVAPSWAPGAVDVPPPAALVWTAAGPDGSETAVAVIDDTGGFRRSGLLRLPWPAVWNTVGAAPCRLRARAVLASLTEPAAVRGVYANAVPARHRQQQQLDVREQLRAFAPLPSQRLALPGAAGVLCAGTGEVTLRVTEIDGSQQVWTSVSDWTWVGPDDRVMVADRTRGELLFGDGRSGRILRTLPDAPAIVEYAVGGGEIGNIGSGGSWVRDGGAERAANPVPATGGGEAEPLERATVRASGELRRAGRTVTASDVEDLARATPGVGIQRAHASVALHPGFPCVDVPAAVTVTVVPHADRERRFSEWTRAPRPDAGALSAVVAQLASARLIGQEIFVLPPSYRQVTVWLTVSQSSRNELLEARITEALLKYLDPLEGGSEQDGWPFGGPVRPSALVGVVRAVLGPEAEVGDLSVALDGGAPNDCVDQIIGARELVYLGEVHASWAAALPAGAGLL
jgi:hypothetical protein